MKGRNLFKDTSHQKKSLDEPCVFISHRLADLETARTVASYLTDTVAVNIYFSDGDEALQQADKEQDHQKIVAYIQQGLDLSTHVLGIISNRTKGSWWVPFELGYSWNRNITVAQLLLEEVDELPSYLRISKVLRDVDDFKKWIVKEKVGSKTNEEKALKADLQNIPNVKQYKYSYLKYTKQSVDF